MKGIKDTIAIFEQYKHVLNENMRFVNTKTGEPAGTKDITQDMARLLASKNNTNQQTTNPTQTPTQSTNTNVKQQNVGDIVKQIKTEVDSEDLNKALAIIQKSTLPSNVKSQMEQLFKNSNVLSIYKQIKGIPSGAAQDPDLVNLQAGSVSELGSPSATGYKQP